jgi:hypothetical protein
MTPDQMRRMRMRRMNLLMAYASFAASRAAASTLFGDGTAGGTLLGATETDGLAVDFTAATPDLLIRDAASTLNYSGTPFLNDGGKLTFSRTSLATVVDSDGKIKWAPHNLLPRSSDFSAVAWGNSATTDSAATGITDPAGGETAFILDEDTGTGRHIINQSLTFGLSDTLTFSVFLKNKDRRYAQLYLNTNGGVMANVYFDLQNGVITDTENGSGQITSVGNGWFLCSVTAANTTGNTVGYTIVAMSDRDTHGGTLAAGNPSYTGTNKQIYMYGAHLYRSDLGGMQDNGTAFPTYNPTVGAAYYGPRIDHLLASPYTRQGLLMEEARTNVALHNSDLTQAAWVASNITPAKNQTGPDNVANSASLITATAANGTILQTVTLASSARFMTAYVKRITGTGTVEMTTDNGSTWTAITVTADWTRVSIPSQTVTNPVFGFRIVTDTDAIAVYGVQNENGAFPTSYIPTTTASVTRAADACSIATSLFPYSATAGSAIVNAQMFSTSLGSVMQIDDGGIANRILVNSGQLLVVVGGASQAQIASSTTITNDKLGGAWAADDFAHTKNGALIGTDASGTLPTVTTLRVNSSLSAVSPGHIRQITYIPRRITNAELQERTS